MGTTTKPLLHLPDDKHPRHVFHAELVDALRAAGCSHFVAEQNGQVCVAHNNVTLDARRLKAVCDEAARFHRGDGRELGMPDNEALVLFGANTVLAKLPHRWAQVLRFLRDTSPADRDAAERMFADYTAWCAAQGQDAEVTDLGRFETAVRDSWSRLGR